MTQPNLEPYEELFDVAVRTAFKLPSDFDVVDIGKKVLHAIPILIEFFRARRNEKIDVSLAKLRASIVADFDAAEDAIRDKYRTQDGQDDD